MAKAKRNIVCCNPLSLHRTPKKKNARSINSNFVVEAKRLNIILKENEWICDDCRLEIVKAQNQGKKKGNTQSKRDKVCCNPFSNHENNVKKGIREISSTDIVDKAKKNNITVEIGQFICNKCRSKLNKSAGVQGNVANTEMELLVEDPIDSALPEESDPSVEYLDKNDVMIALDNLLKVLNLNSIDRKKLNNKFYQSHVFEELKEKLSDVIFTKVSEIADGQSEMIEQMKEKLAEISDKNERVKLLSILPKSWSSGRVHNEFGVTKHMAKMV